jgi:signal transduction histidine kinase
MIRTSYIRLQYRSFLMVILGLSAVFICFVITSLYFNTRLQQLVGIQAKALKLVGTWSVTENLNQELLITYDLPGQSKEWQRSVELFDKEFTIFLETLAANKSLANNLDLQIRVAKTSMHWVVVRKRLKEAKLTLEKYLLNLDNSRTGNVLVDFGQDLATKEFSQDLLDVLEKLRWTTSLSRYYFKNALVDVTDHSTQIVKKEVVRLKVISLALSTLILLAAGLLVFIRLAEMAKTADSAKQHAKELSAKIKERDLAERQLRTEKDKLYALINAFKAGIYVVTPHYDIEFQSDVIERKFPNGAGKKCFETYMNLKQPCTFCQSAQSIESKEIKQVETIEGGSQHYEFTFTPFADIDLQTKNIVLIRDITNKKKLEMEATRAGYLSSIGQLAAGVAHEINNPVNGIISLAELIQDNINGDEMIDEAIERIIREGGRVASIVQNLLSYARERKEEPDIGDIEVILSDALALIGKQIQKDGTKLFINLSPSLPKVLVVKQELQQVLLNLLSNSRHALNSKYTSPDMNKMLVIHGTSITIDTREMVRLTVQDSGIGIKKEDIDKVELPFYSTKPDGEGTGLGLSISRDIIEKAEGNFYISSEQNKFTLVTIELPAIR